MKLYKIFIQNQTGEVVKQTMDLKPGYNLPQIYYLVYYFEPDLLLKFINDSIEHHKRKIM